MSATARRGWVGLFKSSGTPALSYGRWRLRGYD